MLPETVAHYRILNLISSGKTGFVYKAIDTRLNRLVAIRSINETAFDDPTTISRVRKEVMTVASMDHPYICSVYELVKTAEKTLIVMEYMEGESLAQVLSRGALSTADTLRFTKQLAEAISYAHAKGVIHRDIKPSNILITPDAHVKVTDFGLAQILDPFKNRVDNFAGSPYYISPEQATGDVIDQRSDIFSIGVLIFQCLTGRLPFEGDTSQSYIQNLLIQQPRSLRSLLPNAPEELERVVIKCLEKEPSRRFDSAESLAAALVRVSKLVPTNHLQSWWYRLGRAQKWSVWIAEYAGWLTFVKDDVVNSFISQGFAKPSAAETKSLGVYATKGWTAIGTHSTGMVIWTLLAFVLGILNLASSRLNYADPFFMRLNAYIFLLIGCGQVIRMYYRKRQGLTENLEQRIRRLEAEMSPFKRGGE